MSVRAILTLTLGLCFVGLGIADATPPGTDAKKGEDNFKRRFGTLQKSKTGTFVVKMKVNDDPTKVTTKASSGLTLVSGERMGIYTPPLITTNDIVSVVNQNMVDVRKCYKQQLTTDPEWADDLILDLAIKKTGRVSEVSVAPSRVKKDIIGQCLMSSVPKWKFPEFTGETDDGITQEVINASFPFSFSTN